MGAGGSVELLPLEPWNERLLLNVSFDRFIEEREEENAGGRGGRKLDCELPLIHPPRVDDFPLEPLTSA